MYVVTELFPFCSKSRVKALYRHGLVELLSMAIGRLGIRFRGVSFGLMNTMKRRGEPLIAPAMGGGMLTVE